MRRQLVRLRGVIGIVFGVTAWLLQAPVPHEVVLLFAVYMLFDGATAMMSGLRASGHHEPWGWFGLQGAVTGLVATAAFAGPPIPLNYFVWVVAAWAMVAGFFTMAASFGWRRDQGLGWVRIASLVSTGWAVLFALRPVTDPAQIKYWFGGYALAFGCALLMLAQRLRKQG